MQLTLIKVMELKEFIKGTIKAIVESVEDLNKELEGKVVINPNVAMQANNIKANTYTAIEGSFGGDKADKRAIIELKITAIENPNTIEFSIPIVINPQK